MKSQKLATLFIAALAIAGCDGELEDSEHVGSSEEELVGGVVTTGDPGVPLLVITFTDGTQGICSGALISPRVVLTAAHCVKFAKEVERVRVYFGSNATVAPEDDPVRVGFYDITRRSWHNQWDENNVAAGYDIGFVVLEDIAPATPIPYNTVSIDETVGLNMRLVGWGVVGEGQGGGGVKRQNNIPITGVTDLLIQYGTPNANACRGDSGGPSFLTVNGVETIVGLSSYGSQNCLGNAYNTRVDTFVPLIQSYIAENDPADCRADGRCAADCEEPDPDCPCAADGLCTAECSAPETDPDCPAECGADGICAEDCPIPDLDCEGGNPAGPGEPGGEGGSGAGSAGGSGVSGGCQASSGAGGFSLACIFFGLALVTRRRKSATR